MIISDNPPFAFVHIPKCAGTSMRKRLSNLKGAIEYFGRHPHPDYGILVHSHMPLAVVQKEFPGDFRKIIDHPSFAIVRDPFTRFPSSFFQHIRLYVNPEPKELRTEEVRERLSEVMDRLHRHRNDEMLPSEYIHFQRQTSYVFLNGEQMVKHLHPFEDLDGFLRDFKSRTGIDLKRSEQAPTARSNQTPFLYRNAFLKALVKGPRPFKGKLFPLLPRTVQERVKRSLFVPAAKKTEKLFLSSRVREFILDYYQDDLRLHEALIHGKPVSAP